LTKFNINIVEVILSSFWYQYGFIAYMSLEKHSFNWYMKYINR